MQQVKRSHPGCIITSAVVNTDCVFTYSGKSYAINESVAEYQGVQTKYGICYDMDRVIIVQDEAHTWFFTDAMHEITDMVEVLS